MFCFCVADASTNGQPHSVASASPCRARSTQPHLCRTRRATLNSELSTLSPQPKPKAHTCSSATRRSDSRSSLFATSTCARRKANRLGSPGADVGGVSPAPARMWHGVSPGPASPNAGRNWLVQQRALQGQRALHHASHSTRARGSGAWCVFLGTTYGFPERGSEFRERGENGTGSAKKVTY